MTSPKVIFNCKFTYSFNNESYSYKQKENIKKRIKNKFDYYSNEEKRVINLFDYYTGNINKTKTMNLVLENGKYATKEEIEKRKKQFVKYIENSNLWQCVVSFNNDYLDENINIKELEQEMVKNVIPRLFKKMGFDKKENMAYNLSVHSDTDNIHIHFSFIEKNPNYIYATKNIDYRKKGQLTQEEINFMKNEVALAVERKKYLNPLITITNKEIDKLKTYFKPNEKNYLLYNKKDLLLEDKILRLGKLLYDNRVGNTKRIKYNSIKNKEIITLTRDIRKSLFNSKSDLFNEYEKFKNSLDNINRYFFKLSNDNKNFKILVDDKLTKYKEEYINNYIYNAIVNHANYFYKSKSRKYKKLNSDDLLREIVLKEFKKNKSLNRYHILKDYLSEKNSKAKFKTKQNIINAIKNINIEMEEANKEFSKLFQASKEL